MRNISARAKLAPQTVWPRATLINFCSTIPVQGKNLSNKSKNHLRHRVNCKMSTQRSMAAIVWPRKSRLNNIRPRNLSLSLFSLFKIMKWILFPFALLLWRKRRMDFLNLIKIFQAHCILEEENNLNLIKKKNHFVKIGVLDYEMCNLFLLAGSTDWPGGGKRPVPLTFL